MYMKKCFYVFSISLAACIILINRTAAYADLVAPAKKSSTNSILLFGIIIAAVCIISYIIIRKIKNKNAHK